MAGGNNYGPRLDNRQRGTATQLLEKYRALARDAQQAGDRVTAEYYLQYAEHYFRLLGDYRDRQPDARRGRDGYDDDGVDADNDSDAGEDGRDEGDDRGSRQDDARRDGERLRDDRQDRPRHDRQDRQRDDRPREDRPREDRQRDDRQREDRPRADRVQDDRAQDRPQDRTRDGERNRRDWQRDRRDRRPERDDGPRDEAQRDGTRRAEADAGDDRESLLQALPPSVSRTESPRPPRDEPAESDRRLSIKPPEAAVPAAVPATAVAESDEPAPAPKRRGRPRKVVAEVEPAAE